MRAVELAKGRPRPPRPRPRLCGRSRQGRVGAGRHSGRPRTPAGQAREGAQLPRISGPCLGESLSTWPEVLQEQPEPSPPPRGVVGVTGRRERARLRPQPSEWPSFGEGQVPGVLSLGKPPPELGADRRGLELGQGTRPEVVLGGLGGRDALLTQWTSIPRGSKRRTACCEYQRLPALSHRLPFTAAAGIKCSHGWVRVNPLLNRQECCWS